ncbi:unnamed protein product [Rotaria sp. Silwood2]|nr:unnamed protein product [Rotaria sp. Silwood2]CAF4385289.1 unnamed protein product [Rotaria sp. Silwood2]
MHIVYPTMCGISMSCKNEFADVIQAHIAAYISNTLLEFQFEDGSFGELALTKCKKATDSSFNSLLRLRRGAQGTTKKYTTEKGTTTKSATTKCATRASTITKSATTTSTTTKRTTTKSMTTKSATTKCATRASTTTKSATTASTTTQGKQLYVL